MKKVALFLLHCCLLAAASTASCPIFLTIALEGKSLSESCLEINWGPDCIAPPEWVGFYRQDPSVSNFQPEFRFDGIHDRMGKIQTNIKLGKLHFPGGWDRREKDDLTATTVYPNGKCLPFYVASYNGTELLSIYCLKIQPNWLSNLKASARVPLKRLFIPGTHASGAFSTNLNKTKSLLIKDYLLVQHFDVWTQLVFGIRYLDIGVGYRKSDTDDSEDNDFWVVNENMFINPLTNVLRDVRRFVGLSNEVVILDFSSFPIGFYKHPEIFRRLYYVIAWELGEVAYTRNVTANEHCADRSVQELRVIGKTIVILFPTEELPHPEQESTLLCAPWQRFSTSYINISQALDYMRWIFSKKPTSPVFDDGWIFVAVNSMEQSINASKLQSAKNRSLVINPKVIQWLSGPWGLNANVVAIDYFSNTNLIDLAIRVNAYNDFLASNKGFIKLDIQSRR